MSKTPLIERRIGDRHRRKVVNGHARPGVFRWRTDRWLTRMSESGSIVS
jgi:hypothetical protein